MNLADSESVYTKRHQNSTGRTETRSAPPDRIYYVVTAYLDDTSPENSNRVPLM